MYTPRYFQAHELVPPKVYQDRGDKALQLLDDRLLITLDNLRLAFGSMTVNNWYWGGNREWSGLRTQDSPFGTEYSQHRFGRAADCLFRHATTEYVRNEILYNPDRFPLINSVELGTSWLHFDVRNCHRILTYAP